MRRRSFSVLAQMPVYTTATILKMPEWFVLVGSRTCVCSLWREVVLDPLTVQAWSVVLCCSPFQCISTVSVSEWRCAASWWSRGRSGQGRGVCQWSVGDSMQQRLGREWGPRRLQAARILRWTEWVVVMWNVVRTRTVCVHVACFLNG